MYYGSIRDVVNPLIVYLLNVEYYLNHCVFTINSTD
uniref:Uncharacterized protein n=1 Tax=viral metagenome TaxID=1070528 RepID=A0A6C0BMS3_9ZZZZ